MDTPIGGEHPEPGRGVDPGAESSDHPALRRLAERLRRATGGLRDRLTEYLRAADAETNAETETNGDGAT